MAAACHDMLKRKHSIETNFPLPVEKIVEASFTVALGPDTHVKGKYWCLESRGCNSLPVTKQHTENARGEEAAVS